MSHYPSFPYLPPVNYNSPLNLLSEQMEIPAQWDDFFAWNFLGSDYTDHKWHCHQQAHPDPFIPEAGYPQQETQEEG
jgi:hypothetical protein